MKKFILGALFAFTGLNALGQVTVEHTYNNNDGKFYLIKETTLSLEVDVKGYMIVYEDDDNIDFYSDNHTLTHSLNIELDFLASVSHVSKKLFNNDDKIEFVLLFSIAGNHSVVVFNEDGDELFNFGEYRPLQLYLSNGAFKLTGTHSTNDNTRIFTLGGTPPGMDLDENGDALQERNAYPNPAKQIINLQYELPQGETATMAIYNQNGQRIEELNIGSYFKECQLDVSAYAPGIYFYAYNGLTKKFVVQ